MTIIDQLGLNHTYFLQFAIFIFAIFVLSQFVYKDFNDILNKREKSTTGSLNSAASEQQKTVELSKNYEEKAKHLNSEIKSIFDYYRHEANAEYEKNITTARDSASKLISETRQRVQSEVGDASKKIRDEAPFVAKEIIKKLMNGSEK